MPITLDIHFHTSRYSRDSRLDPAKLIERAIRMGLDGAVITEHHAVWPDHELEELVADSNAPGFLLLSGFEYTSSQGDILIYGPTPDQARTFVPGRPPEEALARARDLGAACIAAHPTRQGLGFDERIADLGLDALEVASVNLKPHEQRLADNLCTALDALPTHASDAHRLDDLGRYATEFLDPIQSLGDLVNAIRSGRFRPAGLVAHGGAAS